MGIDKINKRLHDAYGGQVRAEDKGDYIVVTGRLKEWKDIVAACGMCVQKGKKNRKKHVVNDIVFEGGSNPGTVSYTHLSRPGGSWIVWWVTGFPPCCGQRLKGA